MQRNFIPLLLIVGMPLALIGCSEGKQTSSLAGEGKQPAVVDMAVVDPKALYPEILLEAKELQGKLVDGWLDGQLPRTFKTDYARTAPEEKAEFAVDYVTFLKRSGQDMEHNWQSYVPYSNREMFARNWFSDPKNDTNFLKQTPWHQISWLHEALLDGNELYFRAFEKKEASTVTSTAAMAHDAEQEMVDGFKENERSPARSFSEMPVPKANKTGT
jgi:hypothetical protein